MLDLDNPLRFLVGLFLLFALFAMFVGGGTIVASFLVWKWSLRLVMVGRSVRPARILNVIVLFASALPAGLSAGLGLVSRLTTHPSPSGVLLFGVLFASSLAATVHAAYHDDCIRRLGEAPELKEKLASILYTDDRRERVRHILEASNVVDFSGRARRRALVRSVGALTAWGVVGLVLSLARA